MGYNPFIYQDLVFPAYQNENLRQSFVTAFAEGFAIY